MLKSPVARNHIHKIFDGIASASKTGECFYCQLPTDIQIKKKIQSGSLLQICNLGNSNFDKQWRKEDFYRGKIYQTKRLIKVYSVLNNVWTINNYSFPLFYLPSKRIRTKQTGYCNSTVAKLNDVHLYECIFICKCYQFLDDSLY